MNHLGLFLAVFLGFFNIVFSNNPFEIDFPIKKDLTNEDYINIQEQLRNINIKDLLREMYVEALPGTTTFGDIAGRSSRALQQVLIDPSKNLFPTLKLEKIGSGGKNCIVCFASYNGIYVELMQKTIEALKAVGFNGYYLYRIGGYPNPTGKEIRYAGVPYSFKIFLMQEAYQMGFNNVLWVDSAAIPLRDPTPIFDYIEKNGVFWNGWKSASDSWQYIFPSTRKLLMELTNTDVTNANYVCTGIFGLKMNSPEAQELMSIYYQMVEMGTPFLSCFPEEFVLTAILNQESFKKFRPHPFEKLLKGKENNQVGNSEDFYRLQKSGYYFFHQKH